MKYFISPENLERFKSELSAVSDLEVLPRFDGIRGTIDVALGKALGTCGVLLSEKEERLLMDEFNNCNCKSVKLSAAQFSKSLRCVTLSFDLPAKVKSCSVVVPCYNPIISELDRCLRSLDRSMTRCPSDRTEICLVDDGSENSSEISELLNRLKSELKTPIKLETLATNQGVSSARNYGFDCTQGEYVFFVDADDEVIPDFFPLLASELERGSDISVSSMALREVGENIRYQFASYSGPKKLIMDNTIGAGIGIRRSSDVIRKIRGTGGIYNLENRFHYEDWELNILISFLNPKVSVVPIAAYTYFVTDRGRNSKNPDNHSRSAVDASLNALKRLDQIEPDATKKFAFMALEEFANWIVRDQANTQRILAGMVPKRSYIKELHHWGEVNVTGVALAGRIFKRARRLILR